MTYRLNPEIRKILSSIVLIFPDGAKQHYSDGTSAANAVFEHKYVVSTLRALDDVIEVELVEWDAPNINWVGEAGTSFF